MGCSVLGGWFREEEGAGHRPAPLLLRCSAARRAARRKRCYQVRPAQPVQLRVTRPVAEALAIVYVLVLLDVAVTE